MITFFRRKNTKEGSVKKKKINQNEDLEALNEHLK
jgi:hypothetical protein